MNIWLVALFFVYAIMLVELSRYVKYSFCALWIAIPFVVMIAMRSNLVPDTQNYIDVYTGLFLNNIMGKEGVLEVGWLILNKCVKFFAGDNYVILFGTLTTINLGILAFAAKRLIKQSDKTYCNRHFFTALFLVSYMAFFGLYYNAIVLRAGIALSLIVLATTYCVQIQKTKLDYLKIAFLMFLSSNMHITATIFGGIVVLLSLFSKQYSPKIYYIIWGMTGIAYFGNLLGGVVNEIFNKGNIFYILDMMSTFQGDFSNKMNYYAQDALVGYSSGSKISFKFTFYWLSSLLFLPKTRYSSLSGTTKYLNVYLLGLILFAVSRNILLIERITDYFLLYSVCLYALYLSDKKAYKYLNYNIIMI
jgi:hypothetical protein